VMAWVIGTQLVVGVIQAALQLAAKVPGEATQLCFLLAAEAIDTLVVFIGLLVLAGDRVAWTLPVRPRHSVWIWAWPVLALLLGVNVGYHALLRNYSALPPDLLGPEAHDQYRNWWIVAICVQPAIVEELCFRGIALRCLAPFMSVRAAILIASAAFALAHLGAFLSVPYLFLLGLFLGIARVSSGGLALPMLLHAAHNACVLWLDWNS
jgi:membrane protease YdiL (CAAX protease family)